MTTRYSPFLNSAPTTNSASCRSVEYSYSSSAVSGSGDDETLNPSSPRRTIEYVLGTPVSMSYAVYKPGESRQITCLSSNAAWNNPSNLVSITKTYTSGANYGQVQSVLNPDGTATLYQYLSADYASGGYSSLQNTTNIVLSGEPNNDLTDIVDGAATVTIISPLGVPVSRQSIDILSGITISSETYSDPDSYGRPQKVTFLDGSYEYTVYSCCGGIISTNREGTVTTTDGITRSNILDLAGRVKASLRIGSGGDIITNATYTYDSAGELLSTANALGQTTSYSQTSVPPVKTTTYPNASTKVDTFARDGTLLKTGGTAVHGVRYTNGIAADGGSSRFSSAEIKLGTTGADTREVVTNFVDFAGRSYKTLYSDGAFSQSHYNASGQLWKSVDPDGVTTLYGYNGKGEQDTTILDLEQSGSFALANTNRIQKTITRYPTAHGVNVRQTSTYMWFTNNSAVSNLVSVSESSVDGLQSWSTRFGLTSSSRTVLTGGGNKSLYSTHADGSYSVSISLNGRMLSATRYDSAGNQLGGMILGYDQHNRQITATDARSGTSTNGYDKLDRIIVTAAPSPDGISPRQITTTFYDNMGRATNVVLPDATSVRSSYHLTGELATNWGSRTYAVAYTYDYAGRMKTMTTWKNFAAKTGAAVTTWNYDTNRGALVGKVYDDGKGPTYTNTPAGRLKTRIWARGVGTTNTYNNAGELTLTSYSDSTPWVAYAYDRVGRKTIITYSNTTETLVYDLAGNLLTNSYSGGPLNGLSLVNIYDSLFRRTMYGVVTNNVWMTITTNGYDFASRLSAVSDSNVVVTCSYVTNSSLVSSVDFKQGGSTKLLTLKQYDLLARLTNIVNTPSGAGQSPISFAYTYNNANQRSRVAHADGSYWVYTYDSLGQVTSGKKYWSDNTPVAGQQFEYGFDDIGNRTYAGHGGDQNGSNLRYEAYTANNLNQYTQRAVPGYADVLGVANSNAVVTVNNQATLRKGEYYRAEVALNNGSSAIYPSITNGAVLADGSNPDIVTNASGNLFLPKTPEAFGYDLDGNMTNDGRWAMTWDAENRLLKMEGLPGAPSGSSRRLNFGYDWMGRCVSKAVALWTNGSYEPVMSNTSVYDGWDCLGELDVTNHNIVNVYIWGVGLGNSFRSGSRVGGMLVRKTPNSHGFLLYDGNGNVSGEVSASGIVPEEAYYEPFGGRASHTGSALRQNHLAFSTKYSDFESGLIYYGYRYYQPTMGRWLNRDPLEEWGGANIQGFVGNNPINRYDRLGLSYEQTYEEHQVHPGQLVNGKSIGGLMWGRTSAHFDIANIVTEVKSGGCSCCVKSFDLVLRVQVLLPIIGDTYEWRNGYFQVDQALLDEFTTHESLNVEGVQASASQLSYKMLSECEGHCWKSILCNYYASQIWSASDCKSYAEEQLRKEMTWIGQQINRVSAQWDVMYNGPIMVGRPDPTPGLSASLAESYRTWYEAEIGKLLSRRFCEASQCIINPQGLDF